MCYFCAISNFIPAVKKIATFILSALALLPAAVGCRIVVEPETPDPTPEVLAVNRFAYNVIDTYYLWIDEAQVKEKMAKWYTVNDPTETVLNLRYKAEDGSDIDRWTKMIPEFTEFNSSVAGVEKTYGFDYSLYYTDQSHSSICAVVLFTYSGSPAEAAGMKRGDIISKVNGRAMTAENYYQIALQELSGGDHISADLSDGRHVELDSQKMYEDPIILSKIFDIDGKKVGYVAYTSFTLDSCEPFVALSRSFREQNVSELILDLRYNRGGYVMTEKVLASLLAPEVNVKAGDVFTKEVYNSLLTTKWGSGLTLLQTDFAFKSSTGSEYKFSTDGANMQVSKIYALVGGSTASASESLLTGLRPYMDVELIGTNTYGKYCGGIMYSAAEWYEEVKDKLKKDAYESGRESCGDWGIYVMFERFADKNGDTPCMPDGFAPDIEAQDRPNEGLQLGDPSESMLSVALARAGYTAPASLKVQNATAGNLIPVEDSDTGRKPGLRIFER